MSNIMEQLYDRWYHDIEASKITSLLECVSSEHVFHNKQQQQQQPQPQL